MKEIIEGKRELYEILAEERSCDPLQFYARLYNVAELSVRCERYLAHQFECHESFLEGQLLLYYYGEIQSEYLLAEVTKLKIAHR